MVRALSEHSARPACVTYICSSSQSQTARRKINCMHAIQACQHSNMSLLRQRPRDRASKRTDESKYVPPLHCFCCCYRPQRRGLEDYHCPTPPFGDTRHVTFNNARLLPSCFTWKSHLEISPPPMKWGNCFFAAGKDYATELQCVRRCWRRCGRPRVCEDG